MEERIVKFVAALRSAGVRVSLAESADAFLAIDKMGIKNRESFRLSLQSTLIKDSENISVFEELFGVFLSNGDLPPMMNLSDDMTPQEAEMLAQALHQFAEQLRNMLERLIKGDQLSKQEMERLAKMVGLNQADDMRYREWMVQRMKKALQFKEVQEALKELAELIADMGMDKERVKQLQQLLQGNMDSMEDQLRQFAGQRIAENMSERPPADPMNNLMNKPFGALTDGEMARLRKEVQRLARSLRTRIALRQRHAKSGQLDAKATIRANLKNSSVPIEIKHRQHTLKPKLVVLCDVSTSMRFCSELMLSLIFALQDQISKTYSFAYIDHLEYISPDFMEKEVNNAVTEVLERMPAGYYNTDLGFSLENFTHDYFDRVDSRTTFIIVGDGRNNYNNPRLELFNQITRRSRRTIWINPEAPALWGNGDSDMLKYFPNCDVVLKAGTLSELTSAVDKLLQA